MELVSIKGDDVTITLEPRDCLRLAQACVGADHALGGSVVGSAVFGFPAGASGTTAVVDTQQLYAAFAAFFRAACVAGWDNYEQSMEMIDPDRLVRAEDDLLKRRKEGEEELATGKEARPCAS